MSEHIISKECVGPLSSTAKQCSGRTILVDEHTSWVNWIPLRRSGWWPVILRWGNYTPVANPNGTDGTLRRQVLIYFLAGTGSGPECGGGASRAFLELRRPIKWIVQTNMRPDFSTRGGPGGQ